MKLSNAMIAGLQYIAKGKRPPKESTWKALRARLLVSSSGENLTATGRAYLDGYCHGCVSEAHVQSLRNELAVLREVNADLHRRLRRQ